MTIRNKTPTNLYHKWYKQHPLNRIFILVVAGFIIWTIFAVINHYRLHTYHSTEGGIALRYPGRWRIQTDTSSDWTIVTLYPKGEHNFLAATIPHVEIKVNQDFDQEKDAQAILNDIMQRPLGQIDFEIVQKPISIKHDNYDAARGTLSTNIIGPAQLEITVLESDGRTVVVYAHKTSQQAYVDWDREINEIVNSIVLE